MKYGSLFSLLSIVLLIEAVRGMVQGEWSMVLIWPAITFAVVGASYYGLGHWPFGKRRDGSVSLLSELILFPYLFFLEVLWHLTRYVSRERKHDRLNENVLIGRRLLSHELTELNQEIQRTSSFEQVATVVDLTCEFAEPPALREASNYLGIPMLDAESLSPELMVEAVQEISTAPCPIYIHCAAGHGRTGLIASLLLVNAGIARGPDEALQLVQDSRPLVSLNLRQRAVLEDAIEILRQRSVD